MDGEGGSQFDDACHFEHDYARPRLIECLAQGTGPIGRQSSHPQHLAAAPRGRNRAEPLRAREDGQRAGVVAMIVKRRLPIIA